MNLIKSHSLRETRDIPNTVGFKLRLFKNGASIDAVVALDDNGLHVCKDLNGTYRNVTAFDGWTPL